MSIKITTSFSVIDCYKCGMLFAVPSGVDRNWRESKETFYCPHGHPQHYISQTKEEKRIAELESLNERERRLRERAQRDATEEAQRARRADYKARAWKGQLTKARKRVGNGLCPCCNRRFENLARHMANKHPEYAESDNEQSKGEKE